jgi:hypothetical protein
MIVNINTPIQFTFFLSHLTIDIVDTGDLDYLSDQHREFGIWTVQPVYLALSQP